MPYTTCGVKQFPLKFAYTLLAPFYRKPIVIMLNSNAFCLRSEQLTAFAYWCKIMQKHHCKKRILSKMFSWRCLFAPTMADCPKSHLKHAQDFPCNIS